MSDLGRFLLLNGMTVTLLALGATLAGRFSGRPALAHGLWLLVLLKLFTPPLFEVGVLPSTSPPAAELAAPLVVVAELAPAAIAPSSRSISLAVTLWLAGAAVVLGLAVSRARRFQTLLSHAKDAAPELRERTARLASAMGLRHAPAVLIVPARISPMLWYRPGSLQLLLPAGLSERLDAGERDALVAHELAHVRRRDHWTRYLELLATTVFWWHPVVWWARLELRRLEEQCCDAWVVRTMDTPPRVYAQALLKTLEFLAGGRIATPALACGAARTGALKERLTMIMKHRISESPSRAQFAALALVALVALPVLPTWAERDKEPDAAESEDAEAGLRESLLALERQAADLEQQLHGIRARQAELQQGFRLRAGHGQAEEQRASAKALERDLVQRAVEMQRAQEELQSEMTVEHLQEIRAALDHLRSDGALVQAQVQAQELDQLRAEIAEAMDDADRQAAIRALEEQIRALSEQFARRRAM